MGERSRDKALSSEMSNNKIRRLVDVRCVGQVREVNYIAPCTDVVGVMADNELPRARHTSNCLWVVWISEYHCRTDQAAGRWWQQCGRIVYNLPTLRIARHNKFCVWASVKDMSDIICPNTNVSNYIPPPSPKEMPKDKKLTSVDYPLGLPPEETPGCSQHTRRPEPQGWSRC